MPTPSLASLGSREPTNAEIADYLARQRRDMQYLLTNLDDLNISRLNARVIIAGSITTDKLAAAIITTDKLAAGAVTADKISVAELSAITANMGKLTSGEIYGAYIATSEGTYPRIEFSSSDNLLKALANAIQYISITPFDSNSVPSFDMIDLSSGSSRGVNFFVLNDDFHIVGIGQTDININASSGNINLNTSFGVVTVDSWSKFVDGSTSTSLQSALDSKQNVISGASGSFASDDGFTVSVSNGIVTSIV